MRALVTGGCGFIGYSLCQRLINDNHQVVVIDDLSTGYEENTIKDIQYYKLSIHELYKNLLNIS